MFAFDLITSDKPFRYEKKARENLREYRETGVGSYVCQVSFVSDPMNNAVYRY